MPVCMTSGVFRLTTPLLPKASFNAPFDALMEYIPPESPPKMIEGWSAVAARPIGEAALGGHVVVGKLELPFLHAGGRVERVDSAVGRGEIHRVADHDRDGFVQLQGAGIAGGLEMKAPRRLKGCDIGRSDLIERAIAVGALVVVAARPVGRTRRIAARRRCRTRPPQRPHPKPVLK